MRQCRFKREGWRGHSSDLEAYVRPCLEQKAEAVPTVLYSKARSDGGDHRLNADMSKSPDSVVL